MVFPEYRPRRMRRTETFRAMIRETRLAPEQMIYPLFVLPGKGVREPVPSMPGVFRLSVDQLAAEARDCLALGVRSVLLFGLPDKKDGLGSGADPKNGLVPQAIRDLNNRAPEMTVVTDVCLCEYTDHGHCGCLAGEEVDNDATLELLAKTALSHAQAGADMVAPSDMMDGRVSEIRTALDEENFHNVPIMSYAVKYASAFYGPFRDAAECAPQFGDRRGYQMDPANSREAPGLDEATSGQAGHRLPGHHRPPARRVRPARGRLPGERRVRHDQSRGRTRLDRRRTGHGRKPDRHPPRRRGYYFDVFRQGDGAGAQRTWISC